MDINERIAALQVGSCTDYVTTIETPVQAPMSSDTAGFTVRELLDEQDDVEEALAHSARVTKLRLEGTLSLIRQVNLTERRKLSTEYARSMYQPRRFTVEPTQRMTFHVGPRRAVTEITIRVRRVE